MPAVKWGLVKHVFENYAGSVVAVTICRSNFDNHFLK